MEKELSDAEIEYKVREMKEQEEGAKAAEAIANALNYMGNGNFKKGFVEGMDRQHRTLQQDFMKLVVMHIQHNSKKAENYFDLRNQAAVELCKAIVNNVPKDMLYLPFI